VTVLRAVQSILLRALTSEDPAAALAPLLADAELTDQERTWLRGLDADGLRMTGLMLKKLRFERLTRADDEMAELFAQSPDEFVRRFAAYAEAVPPRAYFPDQEAAIYRRWQGG
jgi:hypothetical protein